MEPKAIKTLTGNAAVDLALDTIGMGKQAFVFANTKQSAEKAAEDIAGQIKLGSEELEKLSYEIMTVLSRPTRQCERLALCVKKGIAFHHAGLTARQRDIIEDGFRAGKIKIICCTPTLAAGVDLPAFRTILKDLRRYGMRGLTWIPVLEYLQMAGRAGRPSFDSYGESIAIASTKAMHDRIEETYINGEPEEIYSKLAVEPVLRTYLLSLIATEFVNNKEQLLYFFSKTFWSHQFKDTRKLEQVIMKALWQLEQWNFIVMKKEDFVAADEVENEEIKATLLGKRTAELYLDPYTANHLINGIKRAVATTSAFSYLQLISATLEMRPLLRTRVKEQEQLEEDMVEFQSGLLMLEPSSYDEEYTDFLNSIKTAFFLNEWADEKDEEYLLDKYSVRPGEIKAKLDIADWLLYSSIELAKLLRQHTIVKELAKARVRLEYGAKEELLPLLRLKNIGRVRARKLYSNGIKDIGDVKKATTTTLKQLLGEKTAEDVKRQVGE